MKLSIIIPVFNEEKTIETVLERVQKQKLDVVKEIIIVDDGSTDTTVSVISNIKYLSGQSSGRGQISNIK